MTPLKVLVCGGGCAGLALTHWLSRSGHQVVVVERSPALRATGAQIDLRDQGVEVAKRMGLLDIIRNKAVHEPGVSFVDSQGKIKATLMANTSGKGPQSLTSEYEIMRGDLVRILYDAATNENVSYNFDKIIERFDQDDKQVVVYFSDGSYDSFDVLVGADGQGSRIRKAILPSGSPSPYKRLGAYLAYYFIPRIEDDTDFQSMYFSSQESQSNRDSTSIKQQKEFWISKFANAGWQSPRFVEAINVNDNDNFFCHEVLQVCIDSWHKGRVVLLGDAAYCSSPFSGMGTTGSLVGAYVLAGEINRHGEDLSKAFASYEQTMRPFVYQMQISLNPVLQLMPKTKLGIANFHFILGLVCFFRIPELLTKLSREDRDGWKLPDYPELYNTSQ